MTFRKASVFLERMSPSDRRFERRAGRPGSIGQIRLRKAALPNGYIGSIEPSLNFADGRSLSAGPGLAKREGSRSSFMGVLTTS